MSDKYAALRAAAERAEGAHDRLSVMPPDDIFDISLQQGTQLDNDITDLNNFNDAANPATILELLAERDADKRRIAETDEALCNLLPGVEYMDPPDGGSLSLITQVQRMVEDYRQRIAELEARTITVKLSNPVYARIYKTGESIHVWPAYDVQTAIEFAGISLKIEGE